ncbi:MAG: 3-methyl-2-oxobutanoate hydroxymethyltransferase [Mogibacterium sp.]|nr:3-methyl-2-oxobutanoate hydroxymethyltransferase [Mogibacterium sp.]
MAEEKKGQKVQTTSINMDKGVKTIWHLQKMKDEGKKITMIGVAGLDPIFSMYAELGGADLIRYAPPGDTVASRAANGPMWTRMIRKMAPKTCLNMFLQTHMYADNKTALESSALVVGDGADSVLCMGITNDMLKYLSDNYIPSFGHVGVLSGWQTGQFGGYRKQGKTAESAMKVAKMAYEYQENGMKGMTIEMTAREVTAGIAKKLRIPVVQVAGSAPADGSEMVVYDLWGMIPGAAATRHAKSYGGASVADICIKGVAEFKAEIESEAYPAEENGWGMDDQAEVEKFLSMLETL